MHPGNTIQSLCSWFRRELTGIYGESETNAMLDLCVQDLLGFTGQERVIRSEEKISQSARLEFTRLVNSLKENVPLQYLLGHTWFYGLKLKVNKHVLIPRPETEELVDLLIKENKKNTCAKILDIGTGSGCIAIAVKKNLPEAEVDALDISAAALEVAIENSVVNNTSVNFFQQDILHTEENKEMGKYTIFISNPPYITRSEAESMSRNVVEQEPHQALFVEDNDPLLFYRTISVLAAEKLTPGGKIYFEINEKLGEEVKEILTGNGFGSVSTKKDMSGKERIVSGTLP